MIECAKESAIEYSIALAMKVRSHFHSFFSIPLPLDSIALAMKDRPHIIRIA
jgi:hypothetical protein